VVSRSQAQNYCPPPKLLAVVVANALPLVGVGLLGWNLAALVTLYWLELGVLSLWALVRALFAGRPSEFDGDPLIAGALAAKPVGIPVPWTGLCIHLSSLLVLPVGVGLLALVWFFAGAMTVGVLGPVALGPDVLTSVVVAGFGIVLSEGASTVHDYFYRGGYREHSAQTAIQGVFVRGAVIGLGGMVTAMVVGLGVGSVSMDDHIRAVDPSIVGVPLLVGIVLVKFGFDLASLYRDRLTEFDEATFIQFGWAYDPPTSDGVEPLRADSITRVRPTVLGRLLGGVSIAHARRHPGGWVVGAFLLVVAGLFATGQAWDVVLVFAVGGLVVPLGVGALDYWLRYGGVEYRVAEDRIVAYDRLFRTRLWRVERWDETGVRVERDRLDAWLDTSTVVIECPDEDHRLPRLREPAPVHDVFDRRTGEAWAG